MLPDPKSQAEAEKRLAVLEPLLDFHDNPDRYLALQINGHRGTSMARLIDYIALQQQQSPRTIKRWLAAYRSSGFTALADRIRAELTALNVVVVRNKKETTIAVTIESQGSGAIRNVMAWTRV